MNTERELIEAFRVEAEEMLEQFEQSLLQLEHHPSDAGLLHEIFRAVHTIKGNAACLQFEELTAYAHNVEEQLDRMRAGEEQATPAIIARLLDAVDTMRDMAARAVLASGITSTNATLRVGIEKLDRMLDLSGEIAVARGHVRQLVGDDESQERILDAVRDLDRLSFDLQELVMSARLVPLGPALRPFQRIVRDLASTHQKRVALVIDANDVEVDTTVLEHLKDPITHMIRNAIDHGIETPDERVKRGKSPAGTIRIAAMHEQGGIAIRVSDDGHGLDVGADFNVIFEPGFTTTKQVTNTSGRGVGMDVVRRNVEALRGTIAVDSKPRHGTTITIRLPLTVSVIEGFAVAAAGETYVLPIEDIVECTEFTGNDDATGVLNMRGEVLPYLRLRNLFELEKTSEERESVVIVQHDGGRAGIVVDELLGSSETVMKPLGGMLRQTPGVGGSSILGNGRVALVLDAREIVRRASSNA